MAGAYSPDWLAASLSGIHPAKARAAVRRFTIMGVTGAFSYIPFHKRARTAPPGG